MADDIRILGRFVPSQFTKETIEAEIRPLLPTCCQCERIGVRVPDVNAPQPPQANLEWHQDGGGAEGTTHHMVVWASEMPTELKSSTGERFYQEPFDLVWYDNTKAWHRQPTGTNEQTRWFCAIRCSGAIF